MHSQRAGYPRQSNTTITQQNWGQIKLSANTREKLSPDSGIDPMNFGELVLDLKTAIEDSVRVLATAQQPRDLLGI